MKQIPLSYFQVLDASLNFYPIWPEYIKDRTAFTVGWSYIVCWVGLGLTLVASILFALAAICIRGDLREMEHVEMMVKMKQAYPSLAHSINAVREAESDALFWAKYVVIK